MSAPSGVRYSLKVVNNSSSDATFCVYQTAADNLPDVQSLAWFVRSVPASTSSIIQWTIDYGFVWSETGVLTPGVVHVPSQSWPADLDTTNAVTLTRTPPYTFKDQRKGTPGGSLSITLDSTVRPNEAAVGISMSGAGTFAVQAKPDTTVVFVPHPSYRIAAGMVQPGQVLDTDNITNSASIDFPTDVYDMTATLSSDNTWTVTSG